MSPTKEEEEKMKNNPKKVDTTFPLQRPAAARTLRSKQLVSELYQMAFSLFTTYPRI